MTPAKDFNTNFPIFSGIVKYKDTKELTVVTKSELEEIALNLRDA